MNVLDNLLEKEKEKETGGNRRDLSGIPRITAFIIGVFLTSITAYTAFAGIFLPILQRGIHLCLILILIFLWYPASKKSPKDRPSIIDYVFVILLFFALFWTLYNHDRFLMRIPYYSTIETIDKFVGILLVILTLEGGRRTLGWAITIIGIVFIVYAFVGPYMPGLLMHKGINLNKFIDQMYLTTEGLFNSLTGMSATLLYSFIAFGVFLQATNADKYFMDICLAIAGKSPGGPAKVATISSAAMGSISGSSIANVVTTGTLTIPMMKKTGYEPHEAAAIETVASAGGQIMPPIMGTGAFVMAEVLGVPYNEIIKVSIIPALLFYGMVYFFVDLKAKKKNIRGVDNIPPFMDTLKAALPLFIPIIVLVTLLLLNYTPFLAGTYSTVLIIIVSSFRKETRLNLKKFIIALEGSAIGMTSISSIIACACIIVGSINITGFAVKATSIILKLSGGYLVMTILLIAIMAYILGMGLPVSTSYIILSTLGAAALVQLNIQPINAHMMIFWFTQLATITPPVCMTAFAAAAIAGADPMKTGFTGLKFGSGFYFIPILFIYTNIIGGSIIQMILGGLIVLVGVYFLVAGLEGYAFNRNLNIVHRLLSILAFILIILSTFINFNINIRILFFIAGLLVITVLYLITKKVL